MRNEIEIRPTTADDVLAFYGQPSPKSMRAFTVLRDGEIACIAGVTIEPDGLVAFSDMKGTAPKMTIWRTAKKLTKLIQDMQLPAYATTSNGKFLASLGLEYAGEIEGQTVYIL